MMFCYFNNGMSWRTVAPGYLAQSGEVLFSSPPTSAQLTAAFSGYAAAATAQAGQVAFSAAIVAGVQIASTGTPALNGTYALNDTSLARINAEAQYIDNKGTFSNGQATRNWPDQSGALHLFPSTAEFIAFAETVAQYFDALETALAVTQAGGAWVAPAQPAALA
jgi:hypothetical protein